MSYHDQDPDTREQRARRTKSKVWPAVLGFFGLLGVLGVLNYCAPQMQQSNNTPGSGTTTNPSPGTPNGSGSTTTPPSTTEGSKDGGTTDNSGTGSTDKPSSPEGNVDSTDQSGTGTTTNPDPSASPDVNASPDSNTGNGNTAPDLSTTVDTSKKSEKDLDEGVFRNSYTNNKEYYDILAKKATKDATTVEGWLKSDKLSSSDKEKLEALLAKYKSQAEIYGRLTKEAVNP
ncbi:MAG: hypothetical protein ACRCXZ_02020 [Patescibacteria group bacterium]